MRTFVAALLVFVAANPAFADVLELKDGRRIVGDVSVKETHYSVRIDGEELTFTKDEVERHIKSPKEMVGDADKLVEEAKKLWLEAVEMKDPKAADAKLREALPKVTKAREAYATARDCFPDGYPELDAALVNVMKLMRLVRERLGSQIASSGPPPIKTSSAPPKPTEPKPEPPRPAPPRPEPPKPEPPKPEPPRPEPPRPEPPRVEGTPEQRLATALEVAKSPDRRARPADRDTARAGIDGIGGAMARSLSVFLLRDDKDWGLVSDSVRIKAQSFEQTYGGRLLKKSDTEMTLVCAAGEVRLWKTGAAWKVALPGGQPFEPLEVKLAEDVKGPAYDVLQAFLASPPADPLAAARSLAESSKAILAKDASARVDALQVFLAGHLDQVLSIAPIEDAFKIAAIAGWTKPEWGNIVGTTDGIAMECFHRWLAVGLLDMALVEFGKEYGTSPAFSVKYVIGMLQLLRAVKAGQLYERAYLHFETMAKSAATPAFKEHLTALAKSIRAAAPCRACRGTHRVRCATCHGKTKLNLQCNTCGGAGKKQTLKGLVNCVGCGGKGRFENVDCPRCKAQGMTDCKVKGCKVMAQPAQEDMASATECALCRGRGTLFERVALACPECAGVGYFLWPKLEPRKGLKPIP